MSVCVWCIIDAVSFDLLGRTKDVGSIASGANGGEFGMVVILSDSNSLWKAHDETCVCVL